MLGSPGPSGSSSSPAISAPSPLLFSLVHASFTTAAVSLFVLPLLIGAKTGLKASALAFVLVPLVVLLASGFIGRAESFGRLALRSIAVHAAAMIVASIGMTLGQLGSPGASSHGGGILMIIILVPMTLIAGTILATLGSLASFGVMRALRRP